jgi:hypothetical protein
MDSALNRRWEESYMPVAIKKILLWRADVENKPGTLAQAIGPLAQGGADLKVLMGYRHPGVAGTATLEVYPILGKKSVAAAQAAGFSASSIPALLVEGDDKPGLGCAIAQAAAAAGINLAFFIAQVIGKKFSAILGFETAEDAKKAAPLIKKAAAPKRR